LRNTFAFLGFQLRLPVDQGILENWRENDGLSEVVFEAAAFPLPTGLQGLNPSEFVAVLAGSP